MHLVLWETVPCFLKEGFIAFDSSIEQLAFYLRARMIQSETWAIAEPFHKVFPFMLQWWVLRCMLLLRALVGAASESMRVSTREQVSAEKHSIADCSMDSIQQAG